MFAFLNAIIMKNLLLLLLTIIGLTGCKNNSKTAVTDSATDDTMSVKSAGLIRKFKPIIQGVWVKADYVNKVIQSKSPLAAADLATWITVMYINTDSLKGDSLLVHAGCGNHEGCDVMIKFQPGKTKNSILFNGKDLTYSVENGDFVLWVPQYNERKKRYFKTKYIKILKKQPKTDIGFGLYRYLNKKLIAGNYDLIESVGKINNIYFSEDGKITGLADLKNYTINIDLNIGPNDNLDEIYFDDAAGKSFTFKIIADTLKLYNTRENSDSTELIIDNLKYTLVRKK